ncbi:hypothetical protein GCM10023238_14460 [Streptomyces heliomycini]
MVLDLTGALAWKPGRTTLRLEVDEGGVALVRTDRDRKEQSTVLGRPTGWARWARSRSPGCWRRTG